MAVAFAEATTLNRGCCVKMTPVRFLNAMKVAGLSLVVARRTLGFSVPRVSPSLFRMAMSTTAASNVKLDEGKLMQDMLHRIREVNYIPQDIKPTIVDFTVDGIKLGKVRGFIRSRSTEFRLFLIEFFAAGSSRRGQTTL